MDNSVLISIKLADWKVSFQLLPFLKAITLGGMSADVRIPACPDRVRVECIRETEGFCFHAMDCCIKESENGAINLSSHKPCHFHVTDEMGRVLFSVQAAIVSLSPAPEYDRIVDVPEGNTILVGSSAQADIVIQHSLIDGPAVELTLTKCQHRRI